MKGAGALSTWLADQIGQLAARRLHERHPEWAAAMLAEQAELQTAPGHLSWAFGALVASVRATECDLSYLGALAAGVLAMTVYQWTMDESLLTVAAVCVIGLCLGCFKPRSYLLSGVAIGAVVAAVNAFETLTGIRPTYEAYHHSLARVLAFSILVPPAVFASAVGRRLHFLLSG